ncbi:zinc finger, GRF-type [Artemisia annua]|uniref:Zinc finger, GRF-type n=1 Tax=Artemisia annua TaxID=35608 RepID=A0A2U1PIN5_ARTAN|nr:zinc finger, GRF-type [Artemisia annua]
MKTLILLFLLINIAGSFSRPNYMHGGFTIDLIETDSPLSPLYNSNYARSDHQKSAFLRSVSRASRFSILLNYLSSLRKPPVRRRPTKPPPTPTPTPARRPPPPSPRAPPPSPRAPPPSPRPRAPPPSPRAPPPSPVKSFILAVQWPHGVCSRSGARCMMNPLPNEFTIHGLWPQPNGPPSSEGFDSPKLSPITTELTKNWPDLEVAQVKSFVNAPFWTRQWTKHGKESGMGLREYYEKTLKLFKDFGGLKGKLAAENITPTILKTYKLAAIEAALKKINGGFSCTVICNERKTVKRSKFKRFGSATMVRCNRCGATTIIKTSWTPINPGRRFYCCGKRVSSHGIIAWYDPPMCDRVVQIIPGLLNSMNRIQGELDGKTVETKRLKKVLVISWVFFIVYQLVLKM